MSGAFVHRLLEETFAASSLRLALGSRVLEGARIWFDGCVVQAAYGDVFLHLDRSAELRVIRADDSLRKIGLCSRLARREDGWREMYHQHAEYDSLAALYQHRAPASWRSMRINDDDSVVTVCGSRSIEDGGEIVRRTVYLVRADGSRIEEQEDLVREGELERYEVTRAEFDRRFQRTRSLHYVYPDLPQRFYRRMRARIELFGSGS